MMVYSMFAIVITVLILGYGWTVYNRIIMLTRNIDEAWANIATLLDKRHNLIPRLAAIAKSSKDYELLLQKSQTALRNQNIEGVNEAEQAVQKYLMNVVESYPEIKADASFNELFAQLVAIEDELQGSRLLFNRATALYRRQLGMFPAGVFATAFGFGTIDFFEVDPGM